MTTATTLAARQRRTYAHRSASTIFRSASRLKPSTTESSRRPVAPSMLHRARRYQDAWRPQTDACARRRSRGQGGHRSGKPMIATGLASKTPSPNQHTRSFMGMAISTMGPNAPLRRPRPSIIRRFLPSKCRNLGAKREGACAPLPKRGRPPEGSRLGCEEIPPANYFSSYCGISVSSTSSRLPS